MTRDISSCLLVLLFVITWAGQNPSKQIASTSLIGVWQQGSSGLSSGLGENFRFYRNGKFVYEPDLNNGLLKIRTINGSYRLHGNELIFKILSRVEFVEGKLRAGANNEEDYDVFILEKDKTVSIYEKNPIEQDPCDIAIVNSNPLIVKINRKKYYKISSNPDQFK